MMSFMLREKAGICRRFRRTGNSYGWIHRSVAETYQVLKAWQVWSFKYFPLSKTAPQHFLFVFYFCIDFN